MPNITLSIDGLDELVRKLGGIPDEVKRAIVAAGQEATKTILATAGLQRYPPATSANRPPTPYYERGWGTRYKSGGRKTSEVLGKQFYSQSTSAYTEIGNRASYAQYVIGDKQAGWMAAIGWRKLTEVVVERLDEITAIYQAWVDYAIRRMGL